MPEKRLHLKRIYLAIIPVYLLGEILLSIIPIRPYRTRVEILTEYQVARADEIGAREVVMLGDSSLGNAVDEKLLSDLTGTTCHNQALVAFFGPRGDELLLRSLLSKPAVERPRAVILMHGLPNWNHRGDDEPLEHLIGLVEPRLLDNLTARTFARLPSVRRSRSYKSIFFSDRTGLRFETNAYEKNIAVDEAAQKQILEVGYIPQAPPLKIVPSEPGDFGEFKLYPRAGENLRSLFDLAQSKGVDVFLAIGPHWEGKIEACPKFVADVEDWLRAVAADYGNVTFLYDGVPAAGSNLIGDSFLHLNEEGRERFTRWLAPILKSRLAGDRSPVSARQALP